MKAMILNKIGSIGQNSSPLELVDVPRPIPGSQEILVKVSRCGVCHTELDEIEGRTMPPRLPVIPGHQVVGTVAELGKNVTKHSLGDRVGIGWIFHSDGSADENLCPEFRATGRDADGGYAEYMKVHQNYAYPIADVFSDEQAAPLLCAGSIGYRALQLTNIKNGDRLGLTGFGGSGHLVIQLTRHQFPDSEIYVFARDAGQRQFALKLGATWAGDTADRAPQRLPAIIDTTPAWTPVVQALNNLSPGGRLVINAIRKEDTDKSALLHLDYEKQLWMEREIKTVANITSHDISQFLQLAAQIPILPTIQRYSLEDANRALVELKHGPVKGSKVLEI